MSADLIAKQSDVKPLVYSCSGCSNVAQLANDIAIVLDREDIAEMSCIAGLGGDVMPLVKKAQAADHIIAIDGCPLHCTLNTLARHELLPTHHIQLHKLHLRKRYHKSCSLSESYHALSHVYEVLGVSELEPEESTNFSHSTP